MAKILTIQTRGLGDAVIGAAQLRWITSRHPTIRFIVAGKPAMLNVMRTLGVEAEWHPVSFPASTGKEIGLRALLGMVTAAKRLRKLRLDVAINPFPDFREDFFLRIARALQTHRAFYGCKSDATMKYRDYRGFSYGMPIDLSSEHRGIYWQQALLYAKGLKIDLPDRILPVRRPLHSAKVIGIHPFAGHPSREWGLQRWRELVLRLRSRGLPVLCFVPSGMKHLLHTNGIVEGHDLEIAEGPIEYFCEHVSNVRLLICHDSFSAHIASFLGVPRLVLNGSGDPNVWLEGVDYISEGRQCTHYPCFGRPKCIGTQKEYVCVVGISIDEVLTRVKESLSAN